MGFSQATITGINPPVYAGFQVYLTWTTTSPPGTCFQVYLNDSLAWWGQTTTATLIIGPIGPIRVDIGTVGPGEEQTDFSADLLSAPARRAKLSWLGGTFEAANIAGFRIFDSTAAVGFGNGTFGSSWYGGVELGDLEDDITAYPSGIQTNGFGLGGFANGGYGQVAGTYTWTSGPLLNGTYYYAVAPYDSAGNLGAASVVSVTIAGPPAPPALYPSGLRMTNSYDAITDEVTLFWNASPG
jgi:hypothetical protein